MSISLIEATLSEIQTALNPLFNAAKSPYSRAIILKEIGFREDVIDGADLVSAINGIEAAYVAVRAGVQAPATSLKEVKQQLNSFLILIAALDNISALFAQTGAGPGVADFSKELLNFLFGTYLQLYHPKLYALFVLLELVEGPAETDSTLPVITSTGNTIRYSYHPYRVHFERISQLFANPKYYLKSTYCPFPQGIKTRLQSNEVADKLFPRLGAFIGTLGFEATYGFRDYGYLDYGSVSNELMQHMLTVELGRSKNNGFRFGFTLAISAADDGNLGLIISPFGELAYHGGIGDWLIEFLLTANIRGLAIGPQGVILSGATSLGANVNIERLPNDTDIAFLIGAAAGTHLAIGEASFNAGLTVSNGHADYGIMAQVRQAEFMLKLEGSDGFLKSIIPANGISSTFDLGIGWSVSKGFYFLGSGGMKARYQINNKGADRVLAIDAFILELVANPQGLSLNSTVSGQVKLGPVQMGLDEIGIAALLTFPSSNGNLGVANADIAFKFPAGIKISVDADTLSGGGYLFFDSVHHEYAGVANLKFKTPGQKINLTAIGLLQTELKSNPDAYSLLLLITATFTPIQLGLGFTLNGVGGLLGINRSTYTDYLRSIVRSGHVDQLLFPANVLDNPAATLALVDATFPATEGRYVIGLLARLGWGTPTLITLDVALIIELPAPVRLAILGILRATLPDLDHPILRLRADFLGTIDFATQRIAFDATLHDSGLLWFALSGDMAFRLYQGQNPVFLLTAGGFHPGFQPPADANLPVLRRLTLSLADSNDFRLIQSSYFAVTSNTVQFGSRLELFVKVFSSCTLEGYLFFDTLFHFQPFQVQVQAGGSLAIKWNNKEKLSLNLRLNLTGPGPWHVWGQADFELLGISHSHRIDKTFGNAGSISQPPLPDINVRSLLLTAITDTGNWEVEVSAYRSSSPVVLRRDIIPSNLLIDPNGILTFHQKLLPLGFYLDRYGNARATQGNKFEIIAVMLGTGPGSGTRLTDTKDYFAPGQFRQMDDSIRLSSPSFQLMTNGFRVFGPDGYASGPAAVRGVEYELIVLAPGSLTGETTVALDGLPGPEADPLPDGQATPGAIAISPGGGTFDTSVYPRIAIPSGTYQQLTKNSAIGRAYIQHQPSHRIADHLAWRDEEYQVVYAADLTPYLGSHYTYNSEAEATAYLQEQLAQYPHLLGEILVVPAYQLAL